MKSTLWCLVWCFEIAKQLFCSILHILNQALTRAATTNQFHDGKSHRGNGLRFIFFFFFLIFLPYIYLYIFVFDVYVIIALIFNAILSVDYSNYSIWFRIMISQRITILNVPFFLDKYQFHWYNAPMENN